MVESFLGRLGSDNSFREGFLIALLMALVVGGVSQVIRPWWNRLLQLFRPTPRPPTANTGPSPWDNFVHVLGWLFFIGLILGSCLLLVFARMRGSV